MQAEKANRLSLIPRKEILTSVSEAAGSNTKADISQSEASFL